jgi:hypothetical protein
MMRRHFLVIRKEANQKVKHKKKKTSRGGSNGGALKQGELNETRIKWCNDPRTS